MSYYRHPLLGIAKIMSPPIGDLTPDDFERGFRPSAKQRIKSAIGNVVYPFKNRLERRALESSLCRAGVSRSMLESPDLITKGDKGFGTQLYLKSIANRVGQIEVAACFGCGFGEEVLEVARILRPRLVIGYEYLNYTRAWEEVTRRLARQKIEVRFVQCDLRHLPPVMVEKADILLSFAVLEHLHDIPKIFTNLAPLLKPGGWFTSSWGPLWYTFSGDHIAAELGFAHGYDHVQLSPEDYLRWYAAHPRNADTIGRGDPTWLEMGLVSYAQYNEYIEEIQSHFGQIEWLAWAISAEGLSWRTVYPEKWERMLSENPYIEPLDLLLKSVAVLARPSV